MLLSSASVTITAVAINANTTNNRFTVISRFRKGTHTSRWLILRSPNESKSYLIVDARNHLINRLSILHCWRERIVGICDTMFEQIHKHFFFQFHNLWKKVFKYSHMVCGYGSESLNQRTSETHWPVRFDGEIYVVAPPPFRCMFIMVISIETVRRFWR